MAVATHPPAVRRWRSEKERRLASHPALAGCSAAEIRRIAKASDDAAVGAGDVIVTEDRIGYWFFLVHDGSVTLTRRGRAVGAVGAGGHLGDEAIVGFGPQVATAVATTVVHASVIRRVDLLALVWDVVPLRHHLYPSSVEMPFTEVVRGLKAEGSRRWQAVPKAVVRNGSATADQRLTFRPPRRRLGAGAFEPLARPLVARELIGSLPRPPLPRMTLRATAAVSLIALLCTLLAAAVLRPPVVVVEPGAPFDVAREIEVEGVDVTPLTGRYLVVPVEYRRPTALGYLSARVAGRRILPAGARLPRAARAQAREDGRRAFAESQQTAAVAAARAAGLVRGDAETVPFRVRFGDHDVIGPSAGLVYTLAILDLLDRRDLAGGRTVAATGTMAPDGSVGRISFPEEKGEAVGEDVVLMVPVGQVGATGRTDAHGVRDLAQAVRVLEAQPRASSSPTR